MFVLRFDVCCAVHTVYRKLSEKYPHLHSDEVLGAVEEASKKKENSGELALYLAAEALLNNKSKGNQGML